MTEEIVDIKGSEHLIHRYGERYCGWYFTKTPLRRQSISLGFKDLEYSFSVCDYNFKFIMPSYIRFSKGIISYSEPERLLGVFRFPRDEFGDFVTPMSVMKPENFVSLDEEQIKVMLKRKKPLVFEAYRIPQFGFEFVSISPENFKDIEVMTDSFFKEDFQTRYNVYIEDRTKEILDKISSNPNFLLILVNALDGYWKDLKEVVTVSNGILFVE